MAMEYGSEMTLLVQKATERAKQALAITSNATHGVGFAEGYVYDTEEYFICCCCAVLSNSGKVGTSVSNRIHAPRYLHHKYLEGHLKEPDIEDFVTGTYPDLYKELVQEAILSM